MQHLDREQKQSFRDVIQSVLEQAGEQAVQLPADDGGYSPEVVGPGARGFRQIARMATDPAWNLPELDRQRISATYRYLSQPADERLSRTEWSILQAAAVELIEHDCRAEIQMYDEFRELRGSAVRLPFAVETRADWLRYKRESMQPARGRRFLGMRRSKVGR